MSSAICFNLDKSKILSSDNGVRANCLILNQIEFKHILFYRKVRNTTNMYTDNTMYKINKNNPAEMDRNRSKAFGKWFIGVLCPYST